MIRHFKKMKEKKVTAIIRMVVLGLLILTSILFISCEDKNPVADKPTKIYMNYDLYGNLGTGSGLYFKVFVPTTTEKVIAVRVRKDENSEWEEWSEWSLSTSDHKITILDYSLKIRGWDYWITVRAWDMQ
ncbi:MAG: hypothetical protein JXB48_00210 [Candidatus Latescibacteria bacterium]|nr:hypothetical protein [Candidatus Latescibacterota bacterium]